MSTSVATERPKTTEIGLDARSVHAVVNARSGAIGLDASPLTVRARRRRWRWLSLLLGVGLPTALAATYLYGFAARQYVSGFRFSVRYEAPLSFTAKPGEGASVPTGHDAMLAMINDSEIVLQYLKSRQIVDDLAADGVNFEALYGPSHHDPLATLRPRATEEQRVRYWRRMVDPFFDLTTGIVSVKIRAFDPGAAYLVAAKALALSERLVNAMSDRSHADIVAFARREVALRSAALDQAQRRLADFRATHAVLFPRMQASADTSVEGQLRESLARAEANYATQQAQGAAQDTIPMRTMANRIAALRHQLQEVHGLLAGGGTQSDSTLATAMSRYDVLQLNEQIAARIYERALIGLQDARNAAAQKSIYLDAFVQPAVPQQSTYPVRWRITLETALLSFVAWCLLQLIYHSIRDHLD